MKKTALITGIGGQDGAYLAKKLLDEGYRVVGTTRTVSNFDNFRLRYLAIHDQIILTRLNEINVDAVKDLISQYRPTEVYNLAAQSSVARSFQNPFETIHYNILSTLAWLQAVKESTLPIRFYQATSSEMFGNINPSNLPLKENVIFHPASPYGISKAAAHWLVINFRESFGLFAVNGVLFNHESPLRGENYVIKKAISHLVSLHRGKSKMPLQLGNLDIKRDWGYAPHFVDAMYKIMQHPEPDDFLICSGTVLSLNEFINNVCHSLNLDREKYVISDRSLYRPNELMEIYGDPGKAKKALDWNYTLSSKELIDLLIQEEIKFQEWREIYEVV